MAREDYCFTIGPRSVSLDLVNWFPENSLMGLFIVGWSWLHWAARGCPMWKVSSVDADSGILTIECG